MWITLKRQLQNFSGSKKESSCYRRKTLQLHFYPAKTFTNLFLPIFRVKFSVIFIFWSVMVLFFSKSCAPPPSTSLCHSPFEAKILFFTKTSLKSSPVLV